jgi:hypothetical protein
MKQILKKVNLGLDSLRFLTDKQILKLFRGSAAYIKKIFANLFIEKTFLRLMSKVVRKQNTNTG